jgi:hypothetical protein
MEPIHVPRPPKEAFNKDRPVSDLIRSQVEHFQHLESKLPASVREAIPQQRVTTEGDAARYIAAMTHVLLGQAPGSSAARPALLPMPAPARVVPAKGLPMAASAEEPQQPSSAAAKKAAPKRKGKKR